MVLHFPRGLFNKLFYNTKPYSLLVSEHLQNAHPKNVLYTELLKGHYNMTKKACLVHQNTIVKGKLQHDNQNPQLLYHVLNG